MNTQQFWALSHLIHQEECKCEEVENAAGIIFYSELQDALCDLIAAAKGASYQLHLHPGKKEGPPAQAPSSILQLSAFSREGMRPKVPQQAEDTGLQFEELRAAYRKALPR